MYEKGEGGGPRDYSEAEKWFRLAADQGNSAAQRTLGFWYRAGRGGIPKDYTEAVRLLRLAADQGSKSLRAGRLDVVRRDCDDRDGNGVPQDYAEAVRWYRLAANQNYGGAQLSLGVMYRDGKGVQQDYVTAYMWCDISSKHGMGHACTLGDELAAKMAPKDIALAQIRAKACMASNYQDCD